MRDFLRRNLRWILQIGILGGAGVAIAGLLLPPAPVKIDPKAPPPEVRLAGEKLDIVADGAGDRALEVVRKYAAGTIELKIPGGKTRTVSRAALGAEIDRVYLAALVAEARDPSSPLRRAHAEKPGGGAVKLPTAVQVNTARAMATLLTIKDELDSAPSDARLDLSSRKLVPEKSGYRVDVFATLARIDDAFAHGDPSVEAAAEEVAPAVRSDMLGNVSFDEVLGYFETRYTSDKKHEARTYNLRLAASKLDGHVLVPGETFDFNKVVGPRNEAAGYKVAPVIAQGELVDGIGGGTCQIAGTLHGAVFFSGLEIVARTPHTRPSAYIKMGMDAAVAYPTINFKFKNNFPYPVVLHETVKDGVVRAEVLGPKRTHTVTFVRKIDDVIPFQEVERPDPKVPDGLKVLGQRGIPGFKLHRYRIVREGPYAVRERWNDTYPPTNQIIRVGTATDLPKDAPKPEDDQHPEYTADEYLTVTQGPDIRASKPGEAGGGTIESREAGKTGEVGWTQKAGMSHWDPGKRGEDDAGDGGPGAKKEKDRSKDDAADDDDKKATKKDDKKHDDDSGDPPKKKKRKRSASTDR